MQQLATTINYDMDKWTIANELNLEFYPVEIQPHSPNQQFKKLLNLLKIYQQRQHCCYFFRANAL